MNLDIINVAFCQKVLKHFSIDPKRSGIEKMSILILELNFITMIDFTLTEKSPLFANTNTFIETGHKADV